MDIKWVELTDIDTEIFESVMNLYEQAFPIEVREPREVFKSSLEYSRNADSNNYRFLVGMDDEQVISFATGHYLAEVNSGFIVYIVTDPNVRSRGLGYQTLGKLEECLNEDAIQAGNQTIDGLILETETEEMVHTKEEKENCIKRNSFFERNSYKHIHNIDYLQPPLHKGEAVIPLNLFVKDSIPTKEELHQIILAIYQEKYFKINRIDERTLSECIREMGIKKR